jgi:AraC-like DNA-binding protein
MSEPTVAAGLARGLLQFAVRKGADEAALIARAGIDPKLLADQDNRIPFENYIALMRTGQDLCRDPALALHFAESVDFSELSILGLIGRASETMLDAFMQFNRYRRLVIDVDVGEGERFRLSPERDGLWFIDQRRDPNAFPELTESTFARIICGGREFSTGASMLKAVHVTHPAPSYRAEYDRIFGAPVTFSSDRNAMLIDEAVLTVKIARLPRYAFGVLTEHADALLETLEKSKTVRGRVEGLLMPILHTGDIGMEAIAAKLSVNRQTLFRQLRAEGVTFEKVLDQLRHKMALQYLNAKKVSVNETAYLVGFSDRATFSRAFKRWTGTSPRGRSHRTRR